MKVIVTFFFGRWKLRFLCAANPSECCAQWGDTLSNVCIMLVESLLHSPRRLCTIFMRGWHFPKRGIPSYFSVSCFFHSLACDLWFGEEVAQARQPLCIWRGFHSIAALNTAPFSRPIAVCNYRPKNTGFFKFIKTWCGQDIIKFLRVGIKMCWRTAISELKLPYNAHFQVLSFCVSAKKCLHASMYKRQLYSLWTRPPKA